MVDEINEKSLSGAQRYYMHSQAHDQAAKKYAISAKSVDPEQAKIHRKLGRFHKTISAALSQIAGVHTSNDFNRAMKKKAENMTNKKVNEDVELDEAKAPSLRSRIRDNITADHIEHHGDGHVTFRRSFYYRNGGDSEKHAENISNQLNKAGIKHTVVDHGEVNKPFKGSASVKSQSHWWVKVKPHTDVTEDMDYEDLDEEYFEEEVVVSEHIDLFNALYDNEPGAFSTVFASLMQRKALDRIEEIKIDLAQSVFGDDEEIQEDVDQIDEISGKTLGSYIQKARADMKARVNHNNELDAHPSVKKHKDERRELSRIRDYDKYGNSRNRKQIDKTYDKEAAAKRKLDPDYIKKAQGIDKRMRGVERAAEKLKHGKLTD
jgi:hypothetical protein